ncbi:hypothetical protein GLOTRDRAFT_113563 [Gloeophyllum trabeum ATCC 11539]|uniref:Micro-fibrillar-associated protein 1 C-terminal domain-containing protein n=1 Tax=Gloeophyllum trabeum (strain ATCC 11539 / FP-39264 / Madison 617) TaxID=670483 RepID=S7QP70_GLOTA|nr:uncharacterized protein GLOTRDRAFT_113563 [Gloeophyllum trabeum ATCC 11539]EPQ61112.1 hypothetical protein GLOTRDRAFT_113563 [Gloeophyllum trabeum ATCC 11539]
MSTILATTVPRKTAPRPAKPVGRYWKGKAPKGAPELPQSDSDEDDNEDDEQKPEEEGDERIDEMQGEGDDEGELQVRREEGPGPGRKGTRAINVALRDVNISREGKVIVGGREESGRTALEESEEEEEEEKEEAKEESSEYETDSEEEESEEEKPKVQFRPVFVPKRARVTVAEREALAEDTEEALARKEREAEERRKQSHDLVAESIKRELAEKEKDEIIPDVDDTDGLDPEGEFEAWRLRELARIKRDKEEEMARELEREEIERRRALPEEVRLREDLERAKKLREEKPKGSQKFLQKYWHKGAFHQDQEILKRHDYTEATESYKDVALLPKVMQVKDFGKRSRTKYTHLLDQDTTVGNGGFGGLVAGKPGAGKSADGPAQAGCFNCGGPHLKKDCPQKMEQQGGRGPHGPTGANAAPTGPRREREEAGKSWRDRDRDDRPPIRRDADRWRDDDRERDGRRGDRYDGPRRSRSRSRSPPRREREHRRSRSRDRYREDEYRRRRSRERSVEYERDGKRRRVD